MYSGRPPAYRPMHQKATPTTTRIWPETVSPVSRVMQRLSRAGIRVASSACSANRRLLALVVVGIVAATSARGLGPAAAGWLGRRLGAGTVARAGVRSIGTGDHRRHRRRSRGCAERRLDPVGHPIEDVVDTLAA